MQHNKPQVYRARLNPVPRRSSRYPRDAVNDLNFTNDTALALSRTPLQKHKLNMTAAENKKIGLVVDTKR